MIYKKMLRNRTSESRYIKLVILQWQFSYWSGYNKNELIVELAVNAIRFTELRNFASRHVRHEQTLFRIKMRYYEHYACFKLGTLVHTEIYFCETCDNQLDSLRFETKTNETAFYCRYCFNIQWYENEMANLVCVL